MSGANDRRAVATQRAPQPPGPGAPRRRPARRALVAVAAPGTGSGKQGGSAKGVLVDVGVGKGADRQQVVGLSENQSSGDLSRTQGDATLLALLGQDLIASHADSDGDGQGHGPIPTTRSASRRTARCASTPCTPLGGLEVGQPLPGNTRTGVAAICPTGHDASGKTCDGLEVGVGQGASSLPNNATTGGDQGLVVGVAGQPVPAPGLGLPALR